MYITWQTIITAAAVVAAAAAIAGYYNRAVRWVDNQNEQDSKIEALEADTASRFAALGEEQTLLTYGILACLKGLKEQGCNGPVTEAINRIDKHLNQKAHEMRR